MGFLDSFRNSYKTEKEKSIKRQQNSTYRTLKQQQSDWINELNSLSDSKLIEKVRSDFTSKTDKKIIMCLLSRRGYIMNKNGTFDRK